MLKNTRFFHSSGQLQIATFSKSAKISRFVYAKPLFFCRPLPVKIASSFDFSKTTVFTMLLRSIFQKHQFLRWFSALFRIAAETETNATRDRSGPPLEPQQAPIEAAVNANCDRNRRSLELQQMPIEVATTTNCDRNRPPWGPQQDHIAAATGRPLRPQQTPIVTATGPHCSRNRTPIEAPTNANCDRNRTTLQPQQDAH